MNFTSMNTSQLLAIKVNEKLKTAFLPVTIFFGIEAFTGFVGNILIIYVYGKRYMHSNFRYFVIFLAIYDLSSCVTTLPGEIYTQMNWYNFEYDWLCKVKSFFNVVTVWGSAFTLLILTYDRCRKLSMPLQRHMRQSVAFRLCMGGICLSLFVAAPVLILWGRQTHVLNVDGLKMNVTICEKSEIYEKEIYPFIYIVCVYTFPIGIMTTTMCVLNLVVARSLFCNSSMNVGRSDRIVTYQNSTQRPQTTNVSRAKPIDTKKSRDITLNKRYCMKNLELLSDVIVDSTYKWTKRNTPLVLLPLNRLSHSEDNKPVFGAANKTNRARGRCSVSVSMSKDKIVSSIIRHDNKVNQMRRKTILMLILTSVFVITLSIYMVLISLIARKDTEIWKLSNTEKVTYLFFLRLYFINSVVNPLLYGLADPRFRQALKCIVKL